MAGPKGDDGGGDVDTDRSNEKAEPRRTKVCSCSKFLIKDWTFRRPPDTAADAVGSH